MKTYFIDLPNETLFCQAKNKTRAYSIFTIQNKDDKKIKIRKTDIKIYKPE